MASVIFIRSSGAQSYVTELLRLAFYIFSTFATTARNLARVALLNYTETKATITRTRGILLLV